MPFYTIDDVIETIGDHLPEVEDLKLWLGETEEAPAASIGIAAREIPISEDALRSAEASADQKCLQIIGFTWSPPGDTHGIEPKASTIKPTAVRGYDLYIQSDINPHLSWSIKARKDR